MPVQHSPQQGRNSKDRKDDGSSVDASNEPLAQQPFVNPDQEDDGANNPDPNSANQHSSNEEPENTAKDGDMLTDQFIQTSSSLFDV